MMVLRKIATYVSLLGCVAIIGCVSEDEYITNPSTLSTMLRPDFNGQAMLPTYLDHRRPSTSNAIVILLSQQHRAQANNVYGIRLIAFDNANSVDRVVLHLDGADHVYEAPLRISYPPVVSGQVLFHQPSSHLVSRYCGSISLSENESGALSAPQRFCIENLPEDANSERIGPSVDDMGQCFHPENRQQGVAERGQLSRAEIVNGEEVAFIRNYERTVTEAETSDNTQSIKIRYSEEGLIEYEEEQVINYMERTISTRLRIMADGSVYRYGPGIPIYFSVQKDREQFDAIVFEHSGQTKEEYQRYRFLSSGSYNHSGETVATCRYLVETSRDRAVVVLSQKDGVVLQKSTYDFKSGVTIREDNITYQIEHF